MCDSSDIFVLRLAHFLSPVTSTLAPRAGSVSAPLIHQPLICCFDNDAGWRGQRGSVKYILQASSVFVCAGVLPQVDGADVSLDAGSGTQHLATVLPQTLEHHLHGVLQETRKSTAAAVRKHGSSHKVSRWQKDMRSFGKKSNIYCQVLIPYTVKHLCLVDALIPTLKQLSSVTKE